MLENGNLSSDNENELKEKFVMIIIIHWSFQGFEDESSNDLKNDSLCICIEEDQKEECELEKV